MKITVNVTNVDDVADARTAAEAQMQPGDELEIIVSPPAPRPVERTERRPAGGTPASMKGA